MRKILLLALAGWTVLGQGVFTEWTIPTSNSQPHCVVSDSKGRIWFASIGADNIGMFDPATETFRELKTPTPDSHPHGIALGPDDSIFFTEIDGNKIGRVDPVTFQITEYPLPSGGAGPHTPIWDGGRYIWFTEQRGNRIGRLEIASGRIEEFNIPTPNSGPYGIITDAQGNAWFCSFGAGSNRIGRVDARTGEVREFATPTANSGPRRPWIDSRGRIWFTENRSSKLGLFDPATGQFREWNTPNRDGQPYGIVVDRQDQVWYNEFNANYMVRFDPATEQFTTFPFPSPRANVRIVAVDPQGRVWYGENRASRIGVFVPGAAVVNAASFQADAGADPVLAPGTLISIFGDRLARATAFAAGAPLPRTLAETSVSFESSAAPLYFVSAGQINAQVPLESAAGEAAMQVRIGAGKTVTQIVRIAPATPGIFALNQQGSGPGVIVHAENFRLVSDGEPAQAGEFLAIYSTGLGVFTQPVASGAIPTTPPPETAARPEVTIGGRSAAVSYSGAAPGFVGVYQVNVQVPSGLAAGTQEVILTMNGVRSNTVTIALR